METKCHEYLTKDNCSELKVAGGSLIEQLDWSLQVSGTLILEISEPPVVFEAKECDLEAVEDLFSSDPDLNFRSELNPRSDDPGLRMILKLFLLDNFRKLLFVFPMMNG